MRNFFKRVSLLARFGTILFRLESQWGLQRGGPHGLHDEVLFNDSLLELFVHPEDVRVVLEVLREERVGSSYDDTVSRFEVHFLDYVYFFIEHCDVWVYLTRGLER